MQPNYKEISKRAKRTVLKMIYDAQSSHLGSNFSCIDILTVLFDKIDLSKDDVIFSKGWVAASAYYFLSEKGIIPKEDLKRFCQLGEEQYIGLVEPNVPGIKCAGGSMGYGLSFGVGFALQKKIDKQEGKVYVIMSDGELDCGTNWEAANIARKFKLDNLVAIIDRNRLQAMSGTEEVLDIDPWKLFDRWEVTELYDGHEHQGIEYELFGHSYSGKPRATIMNTIKGAYPGISDNMWHYKAPNKEEYDKILQCLI